MKVKAIIYQSLQGSSKAYAKLLGSIIKIPVFSLQEAKFNVLEHSKIIYITYLDKGKIKDYLKVKDLYDIQISAVCHILDTTLDEVKTNNQVNEPLFLLAGSFDIQKIKGIQKILCKMVMKDQKIIHEISEEDIKDLIDYYYYKL